MRRKRVLALVPKGTTKSERRRMKNAHKRGEPTQFTQVVHPRIAPTKNA